MATFNHGTDMKVGYGFDYKSIDATFDVPPVPPTDADGNYILNDDDPSTDDQYSSYSNNTSGSVSYTSGGKGVWTEGNSYAYNKGNTLTEINGHSKSTTSGWTENYFYGGKFELTAGLCMAVKLAQDNTITIGVTTAIRMAADLVFTLAPKISYDITPYSFAYTSGANYKYNMLSTAELGPAVLSVNSQAQKLYGTFMSTAGEEKFTAAEKETLIGCFTEFVTVSNKTITTETKNSQSGVWSSVSQSCTGFFSYS